MIESALFVFLFTLFLQTGSAHRVLSSSCDARMLECAFAVKVFGETFSFDLERASSIFSADTTIRINGDGGHHSISSFDLKTNRFHAKNRKLATASFVSENGKHLLSHAMFFSPKHGVVEYDRNRRGSEFKVGESKHDHHSLRKQERNTQATYYYDANWRGADATNPTPFVDFSSPGSCYPNDNIMHISYFSVILDYGFYVKHSGQSTVTIAGTALALAAMENTASFAQLIWMGQLNIDLQITHVEIGTANSAVPLNFSPSIDTCGTPLASYYDLQGSWMPANYNTANWGGTTILVSECFTGDIAGLADIGIYCTGDQATVVTGDDPKDFAHELGHAYGATHSIQNGMGTTGGIMDIIGSGFYDGVMQFHPFNQPELCEMMTALIDTNCPDIVQSSTPSLRSCGDSILAPWEQCECADGSTSCGTCVHCNLTAPTTCSTTFAIRQPSDLGFIKVGPLLLSSPECCNDGQSAIATSCNSGQSMCNLGGFCVSICNALGYTACGTDSTGCVQQCMVGGECLGLSSQLTSENYVLNAAINGTLCYFEGSPDSIGTCASGQCFFDGQSGGFSGATASDTRAPTLAPVAAITEAPTPPQTSPLCSTIKMKASCAAPCSWCPNVGCQETCPYRSHLRPTH